MSVYQKYRALMKAMEFSFQGVELSHPIAPLLWGVANGEKVFSLKHLGKLFLSLDVSKMKVPEGCSFISTFIDGYRKDHYDLYNSVIERLTKKPAVTYLYELPKKVALYPLLTVKTFIIVFCKLSSQEVSFLDKIHFAVEISYLIHTIKELDKMDFSSVHRYLCMSHVFSMENLLAQYLKKQGITTFSLEEGIFFIYRNTIPLVCISYELFVADHLLCWGSYTKDEFTAYGIDPKRISVAGYPKQSSLLPMKQDNKYRKCLVMLAGPIFGDVNVKLLELLDNIRDDYDITLKSHPANFNIMRSYAIEHNILIEPKSKTISSCFLSGEYDFCIAVNTTAYYESWMSGLPCIRYYDDRFDSFYGFDDHFSNIDEFSALVDEYRNNPKSTDEVKEMLEYSIGFGVDNYDDIINSKLLV